MNIEQTAVNEINRHLEVCDQLEPQIPVGDKGILTDGHINVFATDDDNHALPNFDGRVPVQVKGKTVTKFENIQRYSVERVALEKFLQVQGVLYFVVAIRKKDRKKRAYYLDLSPFRIMDILSGMKPKQQSVTLHFKRFPKDSGKITGIVRLALQRQQEDPKLGTLDIDPASIQGIAVHIVEDIDFSKPVTLDGAEIDFSVEVTTKTGRMLVDANISVTPSDYLPRVVEIPVASGEWKVDRYSWRRVGMTESEVRVTPGITLTSSRIDETTSLSVNYVPVDNLAQRHFDLGFIISLLGTGDLRFGSESDILPFPLPDDMDDLERQFQTLDELVDLLAHLEIDPALISLDSVTEKQWWQLNSMYNALCKEEEFQQDLDSHGRILQPIGPWFIELFVTPGSWDGYRRLHGLTDPQTASWAVRGIDKGKTLFYVVTPYELIDRERLPQTLNLRPCALREHYDQVRDYEHSGRMATETVLAFLHAADANEARRDEFLHLANELNEWVIDKDGDQPYLLINRWQIQARKGPLEAGVRSAIRSLRRGLSDSPDDQRSAVACAILLGDEEEVEDLVEYMTNDQLKVLESWPIWTMWTRTSRRELEI